VSQKPEFVTYTCGTCGKDRHVKYRQGTTNYHKDCHSCAGKKNNVARWATTHGGNGTKIYRMWCGMKQRCYTPTSQSYRFYGGRGIKICDDWLDFATFRDWSMSHGYTENKMELHRKKSNRDYCPENCEWLPMKEHRRKTTNAVVTLLDVAVIKRLLKDGHRPFRIARMYEVNPCVVGSIRKGRAWSWAESA
jgi:hypothetical protein